MTFIGVALNYIKHDLGSHLPLEFLEVPVMTKICKNQAASE